MLSTHPSKKMRFVWLRANSASYGQKHSGVDRCHKQTDKQTHYWSLMSNAASNCSTGRTKSMKIQK